MAPVMGGMNGSRVPSMEVHPLGILDWVVHSFLVIITTLYL